MDGGGKLLLQAERVSVGRGRQAVAPGVSVLDEGFFASGFSQYEVAGVRGLEVVEGARVRVTMPVLRYTAQAPNASDRNTALETWTPPLYQDDPLKRVLTQRLGADLTLRTGAIYSPDDDRATAQLTLARGASIEVDPRQAIALRGAGQITIDGALRAPGGTLRIDQPPVALKDNRGDGSGPSVRCGWAMARCWMWPDARPWPWMRRDGGTAGWIRAAPSSSAARSIRPGLGHVGGCLRGAAPRLAAGSVRCVRDPGSAAGRQRRRRQRRGSISLSSYDGLYLDGTLRARGRPARLAACCR